MNAVEIEEAISTLAEQPFDAGEFPYAFLLAFGNKETTIKRLRTGASNKSDIDGVLQTSNIHLKTCIKGEVAQTLTALKDSPATTKSKAKFILATDGTDLEAEDITTGDTIACAYTDFPDHFGFFLPLAGISTVKQIRESAFDIRATSRLNRLYVKLIEDNPNWGTAARRHDMNHFMARLIFCFFAEDTDIFVSDNLFTATIDQMSNRDGSNTHEIISEIFRAMNTAIADRAGAKLPRWADAFPYVNGGLFSGSTEAPRFSKIAQRYLSHIGSLDWTQINPDIFGSMIQAVADDEERGALGMHYTSVPNILKVLNPLFLDDLREALTAAGDNPRKLKNLRARMAKIRVFDPACGSGNFLVIAYKEIRALEFELNKRSGTPERRSDIPLTNYRGIELRDFSAEIARLALIIAEYQCDVTYLGQKEALAEFLPLDAQNWITCGNALRLDWLSICPPTGTGVTFQSDDLFMSPLEQAQIDFENEGGETYICGNPPYLGSTWQSKEQKEDLGRIFDGRTKSWKSLDYVAGWFMKAADYGLHTPTLSAFVSTNSICQGQQVPILWPLIFETGHEISFAHTSFKWANLASHNAGVTVAIIGISNHAGQGRKLYSLDSEGETVLKEGDNINAYLVAAPNVVVQKSSKPLTGVAEMSFGNKPVDGGNLLMSSDEVAALNLTPDQHKRFIRRIYGSAEFIRGLERYCLWVEDRHLEEAMQIAPVKARIEGVRKMRLDSRDKSANEMAKRAHQMREMRIGDSWTLAMPRTSSEARPFLPAGIIDNRSSVTSEAFALYDAPLWNMALIASRIHLVWIATVCGKLETRYRYSNTMGWNTFPVPKLTEKNKADLTRCATDILLAREAHFPATIADLYNPDTMPENLRAAHARNDEVLERIYIGRRFRNDTERLEKLFDMYTKMTTKVSA
ncbi:class I SAM-dependent DNA methyltransferase [Roseovarius dicentrarchi]|uniref:class I SAM-dependent DNA methyltransferase n=1 Tax=Roseovarius dicentrarchi TaxID=2250573 RepID=UPI000DEAF973|nr:DNA methyltransferase [Roseovarius dicentrarchi]